ncbi:hypothetical protein SDC9_49394 [bioreactor metagenome]|uniref:AntA/AntB antirepressor domain-containing protein n=1 Tax=bioreactor metagenome TaxID=1076179 RepID=A0A644WLM2_9ZZZZ
MYSTQAPGGLQEVTYVTADNDRPLVSARELHGFLEVGARYNDWFPRMREYGFADGVDFNLLKNEQVQNEGGRMVSRTVEDAAMSLDMAKEICMIQRNIKGKETLFMATDVCEHFEVINRNRLMQTLDADEKGGTQMNTPGGMQYVAFVNDAGLYNLLFAMQIKTLISIEGMSRGNNMVTALGYSNPRDVLAKHFKGVAKCYPP